LFCTQNKYSENFNSYGYLNNDIYGINLGQEITLTTPITGNIVAFEKFSGTYKKVNAYPLIQVRPIASPLWTFSVEMTGTSVTGLYARTATLSNITVDWLGYTGSSFIKQTVHQNLHIALQTIEWTGSLFSGIHTISFFVDGGTGIIFDTNDTIKVDILKY
jgi:hypothetical protein